MKGHTVISLVLSSVIASSSAWATVKSPASYTEPTEMAITIPVSFDQKSCGGSQNTPCPLYSNGNQQIPIEVNYNQGVSAPPSDFDPKYFKSPLLQFSADNQTIRIDDTKWVDGIKISSQPNEYRYGQVNSKKPPVAENLRAAINQYYVSFQPGTQQRIVKLIAKLPVKSISSDASNMDGYINQVPPYTYQPSDFTLEVVGTGTQGLMPSGVKYDYGLLDINAPAGSDLGFHDVAAARFDTENYLGGSSTAPVDGLPGIMAAKIASGPAFIYQDSAWATDTIYLSTKTEKDARTQGKVKLPFYEMHDTGSTKANTLTCIAIYGSDIYGNLMGKDIDHGFQIPVQVKDGELQPSTQQTGCSNG